MCIRKGKRSEIHDLNFHPKKLEKEDQIKTKVSKKKKKKVINTGKEEKYRYTVSGSYTVHEMYTIA